MFLDALFRRYQWLMYREIYQITDNPWDTEDVIQMVWVKLLDKVSLLRSRDTTRLVNYIIAACRNTAITYRQQKKRLAEYTKKHWQTS